VCEQAGGLASDGSRAILDIEPQDLHQRAPLFIGSKEDVLTAEKHIRGES
jgi:fructose-1,6-bisphosphatase I